ncbi:hypothetical protein Xen7305DRAFT_00033020 [Xenococcus sp. PCC 7305]|uniref:MerR family transcriptional regulator n=1 Tax=Xenococcus sp. PCC 7305 TaxID=102125 RepID=UPI0002ABC2A4|nr:MerR family transcriptional regulator [Xenococcus sp. PCC 7305]ELS03578.1 hypothetical protein Xen7305DRAFT_00033020 [Xenococcus sp. PCC 7305]
MKLKDKFTRQETLELAGATSNQLQYLERLELIQPSRITKNRKKPLVFYTWEQILEIRAVRDLRNQNVSLQTVRKIIQFLDDSKIDNNLRDKLLVAVDEDVFWVNQDWSDFGEQMTRISALVVASKKNNNIGQYTLIVIPALKEIVEQVWEIAQQSKVINLEEFKKRAKAKPVNIPQLC